MTDIATEVISRKRFLELLEISDSTERRKRKEARDGYPWPPHLRIGNKVYYRHAAVEDFLRAQEAACQAEATQPVDVGLGHSPLPEPHDGPVSAVSPRVLGSRAQDGVR